MAKFRRIGAGFCGSVWALPEDSSAFKREDGGPDRSLLNDFEIHERVLKSFEQLAGLEATCPRIQVPRCHRFITADDQNWWICLDRFPEGYTPCNTIQSERIPPLPQNIREFLIDQYCPPSLSAEIKASDANQDCLVRLYLGRRRFAPTATVSQRSRPSRLQAFSLRNFPLHVDQVEQLDINAEAYAETMAETLAMMHWHTKIDANDVEFVLAPPPSSRTGTPIFSNALGEHAMWLLDFDRCRTMTMDEKGVDQAVAAFFRNDPYYPRPGQLLWKVFRDRFLQTSSDLTSGNLPDLFIERIEEEQRKRAERINEDEI